MDLWICFVSMLCIALAHGLNEPLSVSQMSPKSQTNEELIGNLDTFSTLSSSTEYVALELDNQSIKHEEDSINHKRIERSALPIINEFSSKPSLDADEHMNDLDTNDVDVSGRYFNYIKPTATFGSSSDVESGDTSYDNTGERFRKGKDLSEKTENSFLSKGGPRLLPSGSPLLSMIDPTSVTQMMSMAATSINPNHPRQKQNPDIQDIITGIVKLLNGNVNVHANTQALRRPGASRINNRGPPKISEAQPIPIDYDGQKILDSTLRPPHFSYDRHEGHIRPYITGVPLPEQIVPAMQQNYRPGFVSQNRLPWHRPRPRPPIGGRRPIPPYKPMPSLIEYHPEDEIQFTTLESENNETVDNDSTDTTLDAIGDNDHEDKTISSSTDLNEDATTTTEIPVKKDDQIKKKDTKIKSTEKKPINLPNYPTLQPIYTTILSSTSVVNTTQVIASAILEKETTEMESSSTLESSIEEVSVPTTSIIETPVLKEDATTAIETTTSVSSIQPTSSVPEIVTTQSPSTDIPSSTSEANNIPETPSVPSTVSSAPYHPRPGIVLDDPEFKPGDKVAHRPNQRPQRPVVQPSRHTPPPGYGEIFDVTLSAIQGPGSGGGSKQTINIKPHGYPYGEAGNGDIIVSPSGEEGFVSIDGKRTYINLFGESTETPAITPTQTKTTTTSPTSTASHLPLSPGITGTGYAIPETDPPPTAAKPNHPSKTLKPHINPTQSPHQRPHYRPRTTQPPVRIDTCIVGDDSTCDQAQNERCKTENGVSSCHCRPGFSRRKHREPCRRVVSFFMSLRVDRIYERRIVWDKLLLDPNSEPYGHLSYESIRAIDSAMSMTPYSDEFMEAKVNNIYHGDPTQGNAGVFVNLTLRLEENGETLRPTLRSDVQKHLLGVIHRRNNNIGNSVLYVESPPGSISHLQDLDECQSRDLNDCHSNAQCMNLWGSFRCQCDSGFRDPWSDQPQRSGRDCQSCPQAYCNNRGVCSYDSVGAQMCTCDGSFYGSQCEIDGEVLGVAIGASVAAVIIIVLTLICLIMWSRKWHREQKNAIGSPVFGYMTAAPVKTAALGQAPYQVTLEDRMRWAQIADVMAQANHYAAEPVASTRPSSAMFGYPNLQTMSALGGISLAGTLPMHQAQMPPVPLPRPNYYRLGLNSRSNGMRTLDNSSSSDEEDRTDLLGRNFQVPRPKSRSNGSIANQSGIYYDVEYEPAGDMYGTSTTSITNTFPGPQGIPMSTYTSGRAPSTYYMK